MKQGKASLLALTMFLGFVVFFGPVMAGHDVASARLAINKNIIEIPANGPPRSDLEVSNSGDEILYVTVTPARIDNPGMPDEERVTASDPAELGMLATPRRLILKPGDRKIIRTTLLRRADGKDEIFRIHVKPQGAGFDKSEQGMQVKVMIAYDVLVIARPAAGAPDIGVVRKGKTLTLSNAGNTNALIYDGLQCDDAGDNCKILPTKRLYSGASYDMPLHYENSKARFLLSDGVRSEVVEY